MPMPRLKLIECEPSRIRAVEWIDIEKKLDALDGEWQSGEILKLENLMTIKYKETLSDVLVLAEVSNEVKCHCATGPSTLTKFGWTAPSMVLDCPIRFKRTSIFFRSQRFKCEECGSVIQSKTHAIPKKHRLTQRLIDYIEKASLDISKNFSDIANETGVHERIVRNIFTDNVVKLQDNRKITTPAWIAIDEVFPSTRKLPRCVITAPGSREVLDILEKNNYETLFRWLSQLPERNNVEVVSIDMHAPYRLIIRNLLPNAKIVVDRYHVHNLLNVSLKEVHRVIKASLTGKEQKKDYVPEHLLLKSRFHISPVKPKSKRSKITEKECLAAAFKKFPELARAYNLKEDFADILQMSDHYLAEQRAESWLKEVKEFNNDFTIKYKRQCKQLRKNPFKNVLKSMKFWMECILNYIDFKNRFDIKVTNAFAEFANRQIKQIYDIANGCSFEVLRVKVIFGSFLKDTLPTHPVKRKKKYGIRRLKRRRASPLSNPPSNLTRIREARLRSDKTEKLLSKPMENPQWTIRFAAPNPKNPAVINGSLFDPPEEELNLLMYSVDKSKFHENKLNSQQKRKKKTNSDQEDPPLFQFF